jgi:nucleotide-binding universal stress UspA family protein
MIRRILVGLAGTPYTAVSIQTAVELATRHGAELTGVTVLDLKALENVGAVPIGAGDAAKELREYRISVTRERVEQDIEDFASACNDAGVPWDVKREEREAAFDYMISQSRYHDLMVFGLRSIFEYHVVGERASDPSLTLVRLITEGVRPILAVGPAYHAVRRVMIAYSGSMESAKTMKHFVQLRPWPDVQVCLITFEHGHQRSRKLLDDASRYCRAHGIEAETKLVDSRAQDHLLPEAAAWGADLIVLGNSAKTLLLRRVFGETALHAIRHSDHPLFLAQ